VKYSVVFYDTFRPSLKELTGAEQGAVMTTMVELTEAPDSPGLNVHRVGDAATRCWSARVNDDIRLIFFRVERTVVPAYVAHHDDAYRWAEGRALDMHPDTGAAQIVIVGERREEIIKRIIVPEVQDPRARRPFEHLTDESMLSYGTPKAWLHGIREASIDVFLEEIGDALPAESLEYLMAVALGEVPPPPPPAKRSQNPFTHPDAKRRFYLVESDEDLRRALTLDWEQWMLYLHPSQREAVDREFAGPARVTGGPGTGKSVVAVHRAARLARDGNGRVLLTSFSKTLSNHLRQQLDQLLADDPARERVDVVHLHHLAVELLTEARGRGLKLADGQTIGKAAKLAADAISTKSITPAFLEAEWNMVVDPYGVATWEDYAVVDRAARGSSLNRAQRELAWRGIEAMQASLESAELTTWSKVCWELVEHLDGGSDHPYAHVIADEAQDFGPGELRLLRALAPSAANDVFLASDANQRIFKPYTPVARAGLEVRGRSVTLRVNYRMTEQIRRVAEGIIAGKVDCDEPTAGSVSLLAGLEPEVIVAPGVTVEIQRVADWLKKLVANGYRPGQIAIFARRKDIIQNRIHAAVKAAGLEVFNLDADDAPPSNRVAIGTMHRSKGLQFRAIAIMGVEDGTVPLNSVRTRQPDEAAQRAFVEMERNLLYVACSRARERLLITGVGRGSEFVTVR